MSAVQRIELGDAVTNALRDLIFDGTFSPGERLVETELAERFGTSRGPVRDALAELEQSGLVQSINRRGSFVATMTPVDIDELYTLRGSLEALAVERAIDRVGPEEVRRLDGLLAELAAALDSGDRRAVAAADMAFHRSIVELADHRRLLAAWEGLADQTRLVMLELSAVSPETQADVGGHREMLDALAGDEPQLAAAAVRRHLEAARRVMVRRVATGGDDADQTRARRG